jgi:hypothetical protein
MEKSKTFPKFYKSLKKHSPLESISKYLGTFFSVAGSTDFSYKHAINYYHTISSNKKSLKIIENADHIFNAFSKNAMIIDVIKAVNNWFYQTLP